ncbi:MULTISPECIES: transposase [Actinomyces]|uniref:Transposase n=1 Tax=Actinomyces respiraculi TaxID=2744574 RepID=A0A7T0PVS8_9ACTO|nr:MULTISPECIES: transposase [Actinomyces]QPL04763.1 transposase [Actinomyces respiraculi]
MAAARLRTGSYFPGWLLERRKRAQPALITVVADAYLAGLHGARGQTRTGPGHQLAVEVAGLAHGIRARRASRLSFRNRPLGDAGPFTFAATDALTMKVGESGRVVSAVVLTAAAPTARPT